MKIIGIGRNYREHAKELNNPIPERPLVFMKPPSALLVGDKPFYYPEFTQDLHYEVELVIRVCKNGKHVQKEFAHEYYNEIALGIDFTARDMQEWCKQNGHPWEIAKGFDNSAVLSEFIPIEKVNSGAIEFELFKNGEKVQHGNSKDMMFSFDDIIVYVSQYFKLQMGDMIYTGTPSGVGPVKIGDKLEGFLHQRSSIEKMFVCDVK